MSTTTPTHPGRRDWFASLWFPLIAAAIGALLGLAITVVAEHPAGATEPDIEHVSTCGARSTLKVKVDPRYGETAHVEVYQATASGSFIGRPAGAYFDQAAGTTSKALALTWPAGGTYTIGVNFRFDHHPATDKPFTVTVSGTPCSTSTTGGTVPAPSTNVAASTSTSGAPATSTATTRPATSTSTSAATTTSTTEAATTTTGAQITEESLPTTPTTAATTTSASVQGIAESITNTSAEVTVPAAGGRLPSTGADGLTVFLVFAGGFLVLGVLLLIARRRARPSLA